MKLLVVESPTKARTIKKFLGEGWWVFATKGHVKDLPENELGVDLNTLEFRVVFVRGKKKLLDELAKIAKRAEEVYIATDPDREGEAIAYWVWDYLKRFNKNIWRITFYEILPSAIKKALHEKRNIDMNLVYSQFARRVLDRLIGYLISPKASKDLKTTISVGRVQSPALRLIVEREEQIENHKKKKSYYIKAVFEKDGITFQATLPYRFEKPSNAEPFLNKVKDSLFMVKSFSIKEERKPPPKPFNTAEYLKEANQRLGLTVKEAQQLAQKLYELGYITYPRTDSHRISEEKQKEFLSYISDTYGRDYVGKPRKFKERQHSQLAHECIRPTRLDLLPSEIKERQVFDLIKVRTLQSLMADWIIEDQKAILVPLSAENLEFEAEGFRTLFPGWTIFERVQDQALPPLEEGHILKPKKVFLEEVVSKPPERYTEGTLIKKLESLGIGRPSTYQTLVDTLKSRNYVVVEKGRLKPTGLGRTLVSYLMENYPRLVDYGFTKLMEDKLDEIEEGRRDWKELVRELYQTAILR